MIFWLKSRAKWKESTQHEISGNADGTPIEVKIVTGIDYTPHPLFCVI
jgi:hypothetical protein